MSPRTLVTSLSLLLLMPLLGGCSGSMNLGVTSPTISRPEVQPLNLFRTARDALGEIGVVQASSLERGLIEGDIPPFTVKAMMIKGEAAVKLRGMGLSEAAWERDTENRQWFLEQGGKEYTRKGVGSLGAAVEAWQAAIEAKLK